MSTTTLILGESGTGKSTSIRTLDPKTTFVINVMDKPLPFKGYKRNYTKVTNNNPTGNYLSSNDYDEIDRCLNYINTNRQDIQTIVIDDFQYLMANEFMERALERGYDKFSEIGCHAYDLLTKLPNLRSDLDVFVLTHSEPNDIGKMKIKTIGKMLDDKICLEGLYATVLQTEISDKGYSFITQGDSRHIAKSPMGMFDSRNIPNDLAFVKEKMSAYYNEDIAV